jgi:hypothetical protein
MLGYQRSFPSLAVLMGLLLLSWPISSTAATQLTARTTQTLEQSNQSDSKDVSDLLNEARSQANKLKMDASDMEAFTHSDISWETQSIKINEVRADVNAVSQTLTKLKNEEEMASAWQKMAIERIHPLLKELVTNTTAVIDHLNKDRGRNLNSQEHKDMLKMNAELSSELSSVINDFVDYGKTKNRFYELRQKLEVSEAGGTQ